MDVLKVIEAVGEAINVIAKVVNGGGIFAVFALADELSVLGGIKKESLLLEIQNASPNQRKEWLDALKKKLVLADKALEAKLESGADLLNESIDVVFDAIKVVEEGKAVVEKAKVLFA